ncbi:MAG: periplasmic heavy metal sensor, partial [Deltaproteobacteria bacterium]|nr:periplasmic heavy metal sensor [Deltaproteobacteria bacterium]
MKKISVIAAFLIVVASATFVMADPRSKGNRGGEGWRETPSALAALNLTAEQSEKVKVLRESLFKEITPIRVQLLSKRTEMRLLWIQTKLGPDKIKATQRATRDLMGQMQEKWTDFRLAFRNILTPEQTSKLLAQGIG